jgi:hypothetical protein
MSVRGGKRTTSWKPGQAPSKKKGTKNKRTVLKETIGLKSWDELTAFIEGKGVSKCVNELFKLKGSAYVYAYLTLTEYVKPKLARKELVGDGGKPLFPQIDLKKLSDEELKTLADLTKKASE